jgi:hypothetical protein
VPKYRDNSIILSCRVEGNRRTLCKMINMLLSKEGNSKWNKHTLLKLSKTLNTTAIEHSDYNCNPFHVMSNPCCSETPVFCTLFFAINSPGIS